jgi:hypothetical protein
MRRKLTLKQRIRNWLSEEDELTLNVCEPRGLGGIDSLDCDRGIRFTAYKAAGGMVVETNFYDRIKDRNFRSLHIITDEQDLGKEIGRIITMETLKV